MTSDSNVTCEHCKAYPTTDWPANCHAPIDWFYVEQPYAGTSGPDGTTDSTAPTLNVWIFCSAACVAAHIAEGWIV